MNINSNNNKIIIYSYIKYMQYKNNKNYTKVVVIKGGYSLYYNY